MAGSYGPSPPPRIWARSVPAGLLGRGWCRDPGRITPRRIAPSSVGLVTSSAMDRPPSVDALARSFRGLPHPSRWTWPGRRSPTAPSRRHRHSTKPCKLTLRMVPNATGVLLTTNLAGLRSPGRRPAARSSSTWRPASGLAAAVRRPAPRQALLQPGRPLIINNDAAAVLLVFAALAAGREVPGASRRAAWRSARRPAFPEVVDADPAPGSSTSAPPSALGSGRLAKRWSRNRAGSQHHPRCSRCTRATTASTASSGSHPRSAELADTRTAPSWCRPGPPAARRHACPWWPGPPPPWLAGRAGRPCRPSPPAPPLSRSAATSCSAARPGIVAGRGRPPVERCAAHPLAPRPAARAVSSSRRLQDRGASPACAVTS